MKLFRRKDIFLELVSAAPVAILLSDTPFSTFYDLLFIFGGKAHLLLGQQGADHEMHGALVVRL